MATSVWCPVAELRDPTNKDNEQNRRWVDFCLGDGAFAGLLLDARLVGITFVAHRKQLAVRVDFDNGDYIKKVVG